MKTMKAARLYKAKDLRYEDVEVPQPAPEEVLIKISANGLCGSDIHFFEDGKLGPYKVTKPYIPGHEASGVVVAAAKDGSGPREGTRVSIEPGIPCRRCRHCKEGRYNLCEDVVFLSAPPINGTFAEYAVVASDFAHPLPDRIDDEAGALVEPVSVGIQAANRAGLQAGDSVAIVGTGPIGLITMLVAKAFGASELYMIDIARKRLDFANTLGAAAVVNAANENVVERMMDITDGRGADVVFDTSGSAKGAAVTPEIAARGGSIALVGWAEVGTYPYPMEIVMERELDVHGVNRYCNTYPTAIGLMATGRIDVKPLVSHRFPFEEVVEAFSFSAENRGDTVKTVIQGAE
jgi:L-iditol 2-dehydrogenase